MLDCLSDDQVAAILRDTSRVALVGASDRPGRPSYGVMRFLLAHGFDVTPVNPLLAGASVLGRAVAATLADAAPLEMVDVFRRPAYVPPIMGDAIALGAKVVWLQLGIVHEDAARKGRAAGLTVVMDRCPAIELPRLGVQR